MDYDKMNDVTHKVYLDDVIILERTFSEHLANLDVVFWLLQETGLTTT